MWNDAPLMSDGETPRTPAAVAAAIVPSPAPAPAATRALIGPNAVLQLEHVMEERIGAARTLRVMRKAGLGALPAGDAMIDEADAIALHHALFACEGELAEELVRESGLRTADYIIAHRIPGPAVWLLGRLPAAIGARMLMMAIGKHAWTFVGAGQFAADGPWRFSINRAPHPGNAADWSDPPASLFAWYAAVFERLFSRVIAQPYECCDTCRGGPPSRVHHYTIARKQVRRAA
jgi:divinyl protochlorophyllide a 8-vinyl-reductase